MNDVHCHFFSSSFYRALALELPEIDLPDLSGDGAIDVPALLGWDAPGDDGALADRWVAEWDRHRVERGVLIASTPGDESAVATAIGRHPTRVVGAFMLNPATPDLEQRLDNAFANLGLRMVCLFPAMHGVPLSDARVDLVFAAAQAHRCAVFVHCGLLMLGVRGKLGLPSRFDLQLGDPLAVATVAARYPDVPVVIPHFGAGLFREAMMAASIAPNIYLDTSSTNRWIQFQPGLTLRDVLATAIDTVGSSRILFGSDSSFFPRGWHATIYESQLALLEDLGVEAADRQRMFSGNFSQVFQL
ncbi:MAG: amidohydrolase [Acidobacteria bacterium]|jgi:uncharacterized protein|nr:amidohydrolase [Acidobacteriota bacterium]